MELVKWMIDTLRMTWEVLEVQDVDDKVGNGFSIVIRKKENRVCEGHVHRGETNGDLLRDDEERM